MPAKKPRTVEGVPRLCCIPSIAAAASLKENPGARLKDTVTEGNRPVWFTVRGVVPVWALVTAFSGTTPVVRRAQVDVFQAFRALPVARRDFQHHVVLVQLRVNDRDLRLAECAVQRGVERLRSDAEPGGGDTVVCQKLLQTVVLLVGVHVLKHGELLHTGQQNRTPLREVSHIVGLNCVLVECVALRGRRRADPAPPAERRMRPAADSSWAAGGR